MKKLLVLGAGTAGTMMVNKLRRRLDADEWKITVVDEDPIHYYQPGFLFIPFGLYHPLEVTRPKSEFLRRGSSSSRAASTSSSPTRSACASPGTASTSPTTS